jgi:Ala-tRNA(Pro) deacylase
MNSKLEEYLKKHNIQYTEHQHRAVFTVAESREIKKSIPGISTKSLFLKDDKKNFYLVCMPGEKRLNIKSLRQRLNAKKLQFASPSDLMGHLHVSPGSVSIFCMIHPEDVKLIIDKEVWEAERSGFHPNINTATLEIDHENLEKFYHSLPGEKKILDLEDGA